MVYLKRYPDKLKIDRSFVVDTPGNTDDEATPHHHQMGRSLRLKTVAEGVTHPHSTTCCTTLAAT